MSDVMIKFDAFFKVVGHLVERLTKHAIRQPQIGDRAATSLLLFVNSIGIDKPQLEEVLNFFSGGSARYDYRVVEREDFAGRYYKTIIEPIKFFNFRYQNDDEIIIDIDDTKDIKTTFIRDLYENLRSIANNDNKRNLFEKFVQKTKTLKTLGLIYNTETPLPQGDELRYLFHEVTNLRDEFGDELFDFGVELCSTIRRLPRLVNNEDRYYEGSNPILINTAQEKQTNTKPTISSKEAIRNEYILHYDAHPIDYENKDKLEDAIYDTLKSSYPKLAKSTIQRVGKEVRKERGMNKKGRPQDRGTRGVTIKRK